MDIYGYNFRVGSRHLLLDESTLEKKENKYYWNYCDYDDTIWNYHEPIDVNDILKVTKTKNGFFIPSNQTLAYPFAEEHLSKRIEDLTKQDILNILNELGIRMNCSNCGKEMPAERAEVFRTCVSCTKQVRKVGFMEYSHKTAPSLIMIDGDDKQSLELARRAFNRER